MPLSLVADVVANGGTLPQLAQLQRKTPILSRRNGLGFSLIWFLFFVLIMTPFWGIVDVEELAGISAVIGVFGAVILMVSSLLFLKKPYVSYDQAATPVVPATLYGQGRHQALPPHHTQPAQSYGAPSIGQWRDTNDLQPTSVVEGTTRLLNEEERN